MLNNLCLKCFKLDFLCTHDKALCKILIQTPKRSRVVRNVFYTKQLFTNYAYFKANKEIVLGEVETYFLRMH